jgi:hypothetical protein
MGLGNWSFIQEWTIYEYLINKYHEKTLRLRCIFKDKKLIKNEKWIKVKNLEPILGTDFPDIKGIKLEKDKVNRPAEIKFTTSLFNYHRDKKYLKQFNQFKSSNGFLIVLGHDHFPKGFEINDNIDIYEIDKIDFVVFCKENFDRLLNNQLKQHTETKVWIMYEGPNFNLSNKKIKSARQSNIWCPTENLNGFDLTSGDRVLFIKIGGASRQDVQNNFDKVKDKWYLREMVIAEITSKIRSRYEYCQLKKIDFSEQLWVNDPKNNKLWRWNRVFEFKIIKTFNNNMLFSKFENKKTKILCETIREVFCFQYSREIALDEYRNFLEQLV